MIEKCIILPDLMKRALINVCCPAHYTNGSTNMKMLNGPKMEIELYH